MENTPLLRLQASHRSSTPSNTVLKCKHRHVCTPAALITDELELSGFFQVSSIKPFRIDPALITALVERWRPETHTFHLPCGECTITLEDVAMQLGLKVNGLPVTGPTDFNWFELCSELLGKVPEPEDMKGSELNLKWIRENFYEGPIPQTEVEDQQYCRAHILYLIGGLLMPDKALLRVNLMYLNLLRDFSRINDYSWGSACLAHLYKELCSATQSDAKTMGGCLVLLQSWAWYRLVMFVPSHLPPMILPTFPSAARWGIINKSFKGYPHGDLISIRALLDHMQFNQFDWMPYAIMMDQLPPQILEEGNIWKSCTALICFSTVEWHQVDRVKLQFGLTQDIPMLPKNIDDLHNIDKRGNHGVNWQERHDEWINIWADRYNRVIEGHIIPCKPYHSKQYMNWYMTHSRLYLSTDQHLTDPRRTAFNFLQYGSGLLQGQTCSQPYVGGHSVELTCYPVLRNPSQQAGGSSTLEVPPPPTQNLEEQGNVGRRRRVNRNRGSTSFSGH